jgi:peptidoglycan/LPS O-acetylase OafA/YrhL
MKFEIKSLTGIRGIAALYVIVFHWYVVLVSEKATISHVGVIDTMAKNFIGHGYLAVDLFFVLSGFVLSLSVHKKFDSEVSISDWVTFMHKRFLRIFPLYVSMTLLYFLIFYGSNFIGLLVNLTLLQGVFPSYNSSLIPPGWSLTNEWLMYLIFPSFFYLIFKLKNYNWVIFSLAVVILLFICTIRSSMLNWGNYVDISAMEGFYSKIGFTRGPTSLLRTMAAYLLGVFTFTIFIKGKNFPLFEYLAIPMVILLFISHTDIILILVTPFLIMYILKNNLLSNLLSSKPVHFLGLISYSLYVNHFFFLLSYKKISQLLRTDSTSLGFIYTIAGTLVFSCITYYGIEKPGLSLFRKKELQLLTTRV